MPKKEFIAENAKSGNDLTIDEIGKGKPVEKVSETDMVGGMKMEVFMNQFLEVVVAKDGSSGSYDVITPNVNSVNQPIVRGLKQKIKRKYVEALARSRITVYEQQTPDPRKPENFIMRDTTVVTYPFAVLHDPHPDGAEWLQNILNQP